MHAENYTFISLLGKEKLQLKIFLIQIALILFDILNVLSLSHIMNGLGNYITLQILLAQADIRTWETNLTGKLDEEVSWNSLRKMKNRIYFTLSHRLQDQKSIFSLFFKNLSHSHCNMQYYFSHKFTAEYHISPHVT